MPEYENAPPVVEEIVEEVTVEVSGKKNDEKNKGASPTTVTIPFPQRHQKERMKERLSKFLEIFKKKLGEFETVRLNEECSAIRQRKLPAKVKDPGSFTLSCIIGGQHFGRSLCDLGASINLMPLSVFQQLAIRELKPTSMRLADGRQDDNKIPLILGYPFLATGRALIDVEKGDLTLRVHDESQTFYVYQACRIHKDEVPKKARDPGKERSMAGKSGAERSWSMHCLYQPP
ncbi:uncharacterized protein LOC131018727 [Salvia miltiorrhiza]|uniref:uncharacterized protein LOC131018727 n=1 Tax=Salvia miltiorrhiza TaxID=226208 RepID=UPI0025AC008F|nr:uncharacterized protein LOC131018727 [Salvia miltiorrhiza]